MSVALLAVSVPAGDVASVAADGRGGVLIVVGLGEGALEAACLSLEGAGDVGLVVAGDF